MSIETILVDTIKPICARVFTDFAPVLTQRPYVTFQVIGGKSINTLANNIPDKRNINVQVNVWADTRKSANETIKAIEDAIRLNTQFVGKPLSESIGDFDADIPVYSAIQDFSIWGNR